MNIHIYLQSIQLLTIGFIQQSVNGSLGVNEDYGIGCLQGHLKVIDPIHLAQNIPDGQILVHVEREIESGNVENLCQLRRFELESLDCAEECIVGDGIALFPWVIRHVERVRETGRGLKRKKDECYI